MNKNGVLGGIAGFVIIALVATIIISVLLIPLVRDSTNTFPYSDTLTKDDTVVTFTLSQTDLISGTVVVYQNGSAITISDNYSISYGTGFGDATTVTLNGTVAQQDYTATYDYKKAGYIEDSSQRNMYGLIGLAVVLGFMLYVFDGFGIFRL